ncbi:hypothetical protein GBAR_LOCUS19773, partial [Geodia barretti]
YETDIGFTNVDRTKQKRISLSLQCKVTVSKKICNIQPLVLKDQIHKEGVTSGARNSKTSKYLPLSPQVREMYHLRCTAGRLAAAAERSAAPKGRRRKKATVIREGHLNPARTRSAAAAERSAGGDKGQPRKVWLVCHCVRCEI